MEKAEEKREKGYFSMNKFVNGKRNYEFFHENEEEEEEEEEEEIELSLGLSLNGKFGVDLQREKRLKRCSSVTNFVHGSNINGNYYGFQIPLIDKCQLVRTCSLSVETEEEWRKRKGLESLRRLEAKRKRLEKMKSNVKVAKKENEVKNGKCCCYDCNYGEVCGGNSLGSSQGSGSSGISDCVCHQPIQGPSVSTEARPPASGQSPENLCQATSQSPEHEKKPIATSPETTSDKSPVTPSTIGKGAKEMLRNFMLHMPCVSTRGDRPNGKKIEGFLYGYTKGEELRIVCDCHGTFFSPAEFVKHAGGGDVAHPLRHIVINPSPLL